MDFSDSDMGLKKRVTWDIGIYQIRQGTRGILSDRNMGHWHILKSTCDIRNPQSRDPLFPAAGPDLELEDL